MNKIEANDPTAQSANIVADNLSQLQSLFPEAFAEGKVQFDVLRQLLGGTIDEADEKYGLNWHGKRRARQIALTPSTGTLRPCPDESVDWETTQNLMIEGDNLEVLKLFQKSYSGRVKLIYIDPPYNTGKDFVYPDNFHDGVHSYLELTGQIEGGTRIGSNVETSGRFHTDWLNMMYPRIKLARNLLADNGVMFISLDDGESVNLRKLCDEIFGEENFIACICHKSRASVSNDKIISSNHNIVTLYAKNLASVFSKRDRFGLEPNLEGFDLSDERGQYKHVPVDGPGGAAKGNPYYTFEGVTGYWRFSEATMRTKWNDGFVVKVGNGLQQKYYLKDAKESRKTDTTWWDDGLYTSSATSKLKVLMDADVFSNPKPVELVRRMIRLWARDEGDVIVDFFAGSGTTGHAVMEQTAIDGVSRRFILVQLPEPLDSSAAEQKASAEYCSKNGLAPNIASLTKQRLKRAAIKVKADNPKSTTDNGFRVFRLDKSNIREWNPDQENLAETLLDHHEHILDGRTEADIVYELLLKLGLDLCVKLESRTVAGKTVGAVGGGVLMLCLAEKISAKEVEAVATGIVSWHKELAPAGDSTVVFRDSAFADDVAKTNMAAILAQNGLENVRSL